MNSAPIHFVTVKWGTKYAPDYVNILHDGLRRNMPEDIAWRFLCFTEDATGLAPGIETRLLPGGLTGWWNKLYLFSPGLFEEGMRLFFFDLDTVIMDDISAITRYSGDFATLRDFYNPRGFNSSLMLWRAGFGHHIWQSYLDAGKPDVEGGDQVWVERCVPKADILQDLFPGAIVSFKEKCQITCPPEAKIICFHGLPRPHEVRNGWVENAWKIGGEAAAQNAPEHMASTALKNIRRNAELPYPHFAMSGGVDMNRHVCLVGGGPSVGSCIADIKARKAQGHAIWAINGAFQELAQHGIAPDVHVLFGETPAQARFVPEKTAATLLYASCCHPDVFAAVLKYYKTENSGVIPAKAGIQRRASASHMTQTPRGHAALDPGVRRDDDCSTDQVVIWHPSIDGIRNVVKNPGTVLIGGGTTAGLKALGLAYISGFGNIHLYGFDSSIATGAAADDPDLIRVDVGGKMFESFPVLAQQINNLQLLMQELGPKGVRVTLHGEGLLPYVMQKMKKAG